jgi:hypothetical protein
MRRITLKTGLFIIAAVLILIAVVSVPFVENTHIQANLTAQKNAAAKVKVAKAAMVGHCQLSVPVDIFNHLETPWQLLPPCHEADPNTNVFLQAVIFDTDTGKLSTYAPLVIDAVTAPAVVPVAPPLPPHRVIGIWGGGNDNVTTLVGASAQCVNGIAGHPFGQMFFCGTQGFFSAVNTTWVPHYIPSTPMAPASMNLAPISIPWIGNETDGQRCPTVRDFRMVDQDQSDNVTSTYLITANGQTAQNTAANRAALAGAVVAKNGSDNRLLTSFIQKAVGCKSWMIPDLADPGTSIPTIATDELQAAAYQGSPVATIPSGDPMTGPNNLTMVNLYRIGVNQPRVASLADASDLTYCENMAEQAPPWINHYQAAFTASLSPTAGVNLYNFLLARYAASRVLLGCAA